MKKRYSSVMLTLLLAMVLSACGNSADNNQSVSTTIEEDVQSVDNNKDAGGAQMQEMTVETGGQKFQMRGFLPILKI